MKSKNASLREGGGTEIYRRDGRSLRSSGIRFCKKTNALSFSLVALLLGSSLPEGAEK